MVAWNQPNFRCNNVALRIVQEYTGGYAIALQPRTVMLTEQINDFNRDQQNEFQILQNKSANKH